MSSFTRPSTHPLPVSPPGASKPLVRGLVVMSLQLLRCTAPAPRQSERARPGTRMLPHPNASVSSHPIGATGSLLIYSLCPHPFKSEHRVTSSGYHWTLLVTRPHPMWRCGDSNPVPPACKAGALPSELHPRTGLVPGAGGASWTRTRGLSLIRTAL
jgi:hypothetical protein